MPVFFACGSLDFSKDVGSHVCRHVLTSFGRCPGSFLELFLDDSLAEFRARSSLGENGVKILEASSALLGLSWNTWWPALV